MARYSHLSSSEFALDRFSLKSALAPFFKELSFLLIFMLNTFFDIASFFLTLCF